MKKLLAALSMAAVMLTGVFAEDIYGDACGAWNDDHSAYILDLKTLGGDAEKVYNDDGSVDVTFTGNYSQFVIPIPYNDQEFVQNIQSCVITVTCDVADKKFALKVSTDPDNSYGKAGGPGGQGTNCVAYAFRDYKDAWDSMDWTIYFNGDTYSFRAINKFNKKKPVMKALAICNNTTKPPVTFHIESIAWCK